MICIHYRKRNPHIHVCGFEEAVVPAKMLCAFLLLFACAHLSFAQTIPPSRVVDWTYAGLQQPTPKYPHLVDITAMGGNGNGIQPNDSAWQAALLSLGSDSGTIYFPPGTYAFSSTIHLRSNIIIKGADASSTTLLFNLSGVNSLINISGNNTSILSNLSSPASKGDKSIIINNAALFSPGDYVKLFQNDSSLVLDVYRCVGQLLRIQHISGDTVTFFSPLRRSYKLNDVPRIQKCDMITGVGIECIRIKRLDFTATQESNVSVNYAARCWIKGVESDSANFSHIAIFNSTNIEITGSYFHGAFGYGAGGQGYGISCNKTSGECLVENNIFRHLRHSILVQSGANGNVFSYNYSREPFKSESAPNDLAGDIVLHGNYPYANLFEGNIVQNIVVDASHYINGPFNTFFRNRAELYGILFNSGSGDSSNIAGNEITSVIPNYGLYFIAGNGNLEYGNNVKGVVFPLGTGMVNDNSFFYPSEPYFWTFASPWPSMGYPNPFNTKTIPAKALFDAGSVFTVCPPGSILSVHFESFTVSKEKNKNRLTWLVGNRDEATVYEVERSLDGKHFIKFGKTLPSLNKTDYFDDQLPPTGICYYRIKAYCRSGLYFYSKVLSVDNSASYKVLIFPNPATELLRIESGRMTIKTVEIAGADGVLHPVTVFRNGNVIEINVSKLPQGLYFIHLLNQQRTIEGTYNFLKQ